MRCRVKVERQDVVADSVAVSPCCRRIGEPRPIRLEGPARMRTQNHPFRLTATVAIAALLVPQTLPQPVMAALVLAQTLPQPVAQGAPPQDQQQSGDPPSRVGRLAQVSGTVSFHTQDDTPVESGHAELPGHPGRRVLDRTQRAGCARGFREPHRDGARHRTRRRDPDRPRVPGHAAAGRTVPAGADGGAGRDIRGADAARRGHAVRAGALRRR